MNVQLWFARNEKAEIVSIIEAAPKEKYCCPICGKEVIPKAKQSAKVTPHFAHIDRNECKGESIIHWWFKNKFIDVGDSFIITTDSTHHFICSSILIEKTFALKTGNYRPDLTVTTECGQEIIFEMANSNKKKVKNYIDKWIELNKIIVEIDIKSLINEKNIRKFKALYYNGRCFNINVRDDGYYKTIGKFKENLLHDNKYNIEPIKELDYLWDELVKHRSNQRNNAAEILSFMIDTREYHKIISQIMKKHKANNILREANAIYVNRISNKINKMIIDTNYSFRIPFNNYCDDIKNFDCFFIRNGESVGEWISPINEDDLEKDVHVIIEKLENKYKERSHATRK